MSISLPLWTKIYCNIQEQESLLWVTLTSLTLSDFAEIHLLNRLLKNQLVEMRDWI